MDTPDYDIRVSLYLTDLCRMSRMEVDLSDITEGASMIIDGTDAGTCILSYEMPNGERLTLTYVRNPSVTHVNFIYMGLPLRDRSGRQFYSERLYHHPARRQRLSDKCQESFRHAGR